MVCCLTLACFFCTLSILIGLASVVQFCLGIYLSTIQPDLSIINALIRPETFNGYLVYILYVFIGLGLVSLVLSFVSICSTVRRTSSFSVLLSILWVCSSLSSSLLISNGFCFLYDRYSSRWSIWRCSSAHFSITFSSCLNCTRHSFVLCNDLHWPLRLFSIPSSRNILAVASIDRMITTTFPWTHFLRRVAVCPTVGATRTSIDIRDRTRRCR